jgi:hypothetical protein
MQGECSFLDSREKVVNQIKRQQVIIASLESSLMQNIN